MLEEQAATRGPEQVVVLRLSALLTALFAGSALVIALFSDSETMSLEAMSDLVAVVVSILAVFVVRRVSRARLTRIPARHFC